MYLQAFVIYLQAVDGSAVFLRAVYGDLLLGHLHVPERFSSLFAPWHHGVQRICVFFAVVVWVFAAFSSVDILGFVAFSF